MLKSRGCWSGQKKAGPKHTLSTKEILKDNKRLKGKGWKNDMPCKQEA